MKRRSFLAGAGAALSALAACAYDPDRALWVPGRKKISIPSQIGARQLYAECNDARMEIQNALAEMDGRALGLAMSRYQRTVRKFNVIAKFDHCGNLALRAAA